MQMRSDQIWFVFLSVQDPAVCWLLLHTPTQRMAVHVWSTGEYAISIHSWLEALLSNVSRMRWMIKCIIFKFIFWFFLFRCGDLSHYCCPTDVFHSDHRKLCLHTWDFKMRLVYYYCSYLFFWWWHNYFPYYKWKMTIQWWVISALKCFTSLCIHFILRQCLWKTLHAFPGLKKTHT